MGIQHENTFLLLYLFKESVFRNAHTSKSTGSNVFLYFYWILREFIEIKYGNMVYFMNFIFIET